MCDVDAMLSELTPEQWSEWLAFRHLEPDPLERIVTILKLGLACVCWSLGNKDIDPDQFDPMPKEQQPKKDDAMSPQQAAMAFSMFAGRPR